METEMLEDQCTGISKKQKNKQNNNCRALSVPVDTFKKVVSICNDWRPKCHKAIKKFNKNCLQHHRVLKKVKAKSVLSATLSANSFACTLCRLVIHIRVWFEISQAPELIKAVGPSHVKIHWRVHHTVT